MSNRMDSSHNYHNHKEAFMRFTSIALICLCMVMTTGPVLAKEK